MNTVILDGNNLVFRCASVINLSTKDGFPTGGIFGTLNAINSYLKDIPKLVGEPISECIFVLDGGRSKRRTEMYPEYKGGRKTDADRTEEERKFFHNFLKQTEILKDNLSSLGIKTIQVKYRDHNIYDILEMSVDTAMEFFGEDTSNSTCRRIVERLRPLQDVGLGYIKLGQSSSTLSGGESQRVKLASFLAKDSSSGQIMFIFDEPTTGLHFHDINKLLAAFNALVENGHTIVVVEHNLDVIKCADWVIDLGAEAGDMGGNLVFEGTPTELMNCTESYTGHYLKAHKEL